MESLWEKLTQDLVTAMKAKDALTLSVLRMAKAAITHAAIAQKKDNLEDHEIMEVLAKQLKQRKESFEVFSKAGRKELAAKEEAEMAILQQYLPVPIGLSELEAIVREAMKECGAKYRTDFKVLMEIVMPRVKGRADGKVVSQLIHSLLDTLA